MLDDTKLGRGMTLSATTVLLAAVCWAGWSPEVHAALVSVNDPVFGADSITLDTDTALEWLDLTSSQGWSADDVASEFGPDGDFEGFRHATQAELMELWINAGIPDINSGATSANFPAVSALIDLVGFTSTWPEFDVRNSNGIYWNVGHPWTSNGQLYSTGPDSPVEPETAGTTMINDCCLPSGVSSVWGHWLVRPPSQPRGFYFEADLIPGTVGFDCFAWLGSTISGHWEFDDTAAGSGGNPNIYPLKLFSFTTSTGLTGSAGAGSTISIANNLTSPPKDGYTIGGQSLSSPDMYVLSLWLQMLDDEATAFADTTLPSTLDLSDFESRLVGIDIGSIPITECPARYELTYVRGPGCERDSDCTQLCQVCNLTTNTCEFENTPDCCFSDEPCIPLGTKCRDAYCDITTNSCAIAPPAPDCCESDRDCTQMCEFCNLATNTCQFRFGPDCCSSDTHCDDGIFCNGWESCHRPTGTCGAVSSCPPSIDGCLTRNHSCDEDNDVCVDFADDSLCPVGEVCTPEGDCVRRPDMEWVTVGDPGNASDAHGYGGVDYVYSIGKYEVTNAQYAEFLNAVAASDPHGLYYTGMGSGIGGIAWSGSPGSYTYSTIAGRSNMPVNYVSWYDTLRFANWVHNGQGHGDTEDGAYDMSLGSSVVRKPGALVVLPSYDEWSKAAYYKGGGTSAGYWEYPTKSDSIPTAEAPSGTDAAKGSANYDNAVGDVTEVGAYTFKPSDSAYGTFDQGGNVSEWTERDYFGDGSDRVFIGGSFASNGFHMDAGSEAVNPATSGISTRGFRVAKVPVSVSSVPPHDGTLWRSKKNIARLTFDGTLPSAPGTGNIEINELLPGGQYGPDLSYSFDMTVEGGTVLRLQDMGETLVHRRWYGIRNVGGWSGVQDFMVHYVVQMGDCDGNGIVISLDVGCVNAGIPCFVNCGDDNRKDIDGDGRVISLDVGVVNGHIGSFAVPKPSGH